MSIINQALRKGRHRITRANQQRQVQNLWDDWADDFTDYAEGYNTRDSIAGLTSLFFPKVGMALGAINSVGSDYFAPDALNLQLHDYMYLQESEIDEYNQGAEDALDQLSAEIWSDAIGRVGDVYQLHGKEAFDFSDQFKWFGDMMPELDLSMPSFDLPNVPDFPSFLPEREVNPTGGDDENWRRYLPRINPFDRGY